MGTPPLPEGPDRKPDRIGPYHLLEVLGEGGMGTVYLAEQREPVKRRVALKLIKLGMDSKAVVVRFGQERQALALMQHEGIARVYDCGTTERGQPYFVMEYVKGTPLNAYCDRNRVSLHARIELMQQVCAAVTHAHQKGVVHRDLKPGNVLVTEDAGKVRVKIIDFGLAKAMGQKLVEATLFTEAGQIVGTPEYMAPEQADTTNQDIDTRADVYSLGVMLYELLVGSLPFPQHELRAAGMFEVLRILREVEPQKPSTRLSSNANVAQDVARARRIALGTLQKTLRTDLDWLVLKALEKDRARRYDTANALAMDLQRYLDHEPLVAGPPSAAYRLKKLVRRYRGQVLAAATVLMTAVVGAVVAINYAVLANDRADENSKLAKQKGELAESESRAKDGFANKVREFDQLAGVVLYERAVASEKDLYPPWPHKIAALETWLRDDCGKLLAKREGIERTLLDLRKRALPPTAAEKQHDLQTQPRFAEGQQMEQRLASLRRAQAIRDGQQLVVPTLTAEQQALESQALNMLAWDRVAPKVGDRKLYGEEAFGLACARLAVAKAGDADRCRQLDTLAWALLANGQDAESRQRSAQALAAAPATEKASYAGDLRDVERAVANAAKTLAELEATHAALTAEVNMRQTWTIADEAPRFLHDTLSELLRKFDSLDANEKKAVEQRLVWAAQIGELTRGHPNARVTWAAARAAIAASEKYRGPAIELRERDVIGLVPIGPNPVTGLWEFYELRSAWDGKREPAAIPIPAHRPDGSIEVTGDTGIVFVLMPGGTFRMGAQKDDPGGPDYDEQAESDERQFEVRLSPFLLARHELTQGQWRRLTGDDPSSYKAGKTVGGAMVTAANPVELISWEDCERWLQRFGLVLPTEAQWEYGCRAGTTTPWSCAFEILRDCANLADATAKSVVPGWTCEAWSDEHVVHAPVGTFRANGFGLFDTHGNVWEWTRDGDFPSQQPRAGDGLRGDPAGSAKRVSRGGSFYTTALSARSAYRDTDTEANRNSNLGARVARIIQP